MKLKKPLIWNPIVRDKWKKLIKRYRTYFWREDPIPQYFAIWPKMTIADVLREIPEITSVSIEKIEVYTAAKYDVLVIETWEFNERTGEERYTGYSTYEYL